MTHTLPLPDFTHERVEVITGRRSGLFLTVALHSSVLGSALGGARLWTYPHWSDALGDALRLSAAMTLKNAAAGLDAGGGKSVIRLAPGEILDADRRRAAFLDLGDAVESLHGLYRTAEDVGSTTEDMLVVSERTEHGRVQRDGDEQAAPATGDHLHPLVCEIGQGQGVRHRGSSFGGPRGQCAADASALRHPLSLDTDSANCSTVSTASGHIAWSTA